MTDETLEQRAEQIVNYNFSNRLSAEEHRLAIEITKEIYLSPEELPFDIWHEHVSQFDQQLQTRLSQAETPEQRAVLRFASLLLQSVAEDAATSIFSNRQQSLAYLEQGLKHAEAFLSDGETTSGVREQVLQLYVNAVGTLEQLGQVDKAVETAQRGLKHAEAFLSDGETTSGVREQVLQLYVNAVGTLEQLGQVDKAVETAQRGLKHAEAFLSDGETTSGVREQVLQLYVNAVGTLEQLGQVDKAVETAQRGLKHAEAFLSDGETTSGVREQVLQLYVNAAMPLS